MGVRGLGAIYFTSNSHSIGYQNYLSLGLIHNIYHLPGLPPMVFGIAMLMSSLVFLFLPETNKKPLPQNKEQVHDNFKQSCLIKLFR